MSKDIDVRDVQAGDKVEIVVRGLAVERPDCIMVELEPGAAWVLRGRDDGTLDGLWEHRGRIVHRPKPTPKLGEVRRGPDGEAALYAPSSSDDSAPWLITGDGGQHARWADVERVADWVVVREGIDQ